MTSMTAVNPFHPPSVYAMADLYPIQENTDAPMRMTTDRSYARTPMAQRQPPPGYPMYSGPQSTPRFQDRSLDSFHTTLKRPRKLSGSSTMPASMNSPYENTGSRMRATSLGSRSSLDTFESSGWGQSYAQQHSPTKAAYWPERKPNELFDSLPGEVLELILQWLKKLHLAKGSDSCATCWMRDLCSITLCSRRWHKFTRVALYEDIQLVGPDSATHKKKFKQAQGSRMALLRRTLRANQDIAELVRSLKVPRPETPLNWSPSKGLSWLEQYEDRVAALIMACPNLERLSGPTSNYDYSFKRMHHALSTRTALKDMVWVIDPATPSHHRSDSIAKQSGHDTMPGALEPSLQDAFLDHHRNWSSLKSLSILCQPGATLAPQTLLARTLTCLPSLQHLHLCNLPPNAFNDNNILSLPRLQSLTLSHVMGITSSGLSAFATRRNSASLQRLELRHTPLTSLPALARIFSHLPSLAAFYLVQTFPPVMPETDSFTLWMMPYLASSSIVKLHWDITSLTTSTNAADDILARSIEAGGFPELKTLRTPNDPEGRFQALCRPLEKIILPTDRFHNISGGDSAIGLSESFSAPSSPIHPLHKSSTTMSLPSSLSSVPSLATDLRKARLAAQSRLEKAQDSPRFQVNVTADDGNLAQSFAMAGYIGTVGSKINYYLHPDAGAADEHGGLLDVSDIVADCGESLNGSKEGCTGRWNRREGVVADKKEKEKWWHTERGRWRKVELE